MPDSQGSGRLSVDFSIVWEFVSFLTFTGVLPWTLEPLDVSVENNKVARIIESKIAMGIIHPLPLVVEMAAAAAIIAPPPSNKMPLELVATTSSRTTVLMNLAHPRPHYVQFWW